MFLVSSPKRSALLVAISLAALLACSDARPTPTQAGVPVQVAGVRTDGAHQLIVLLEDPEGKRVLPIWIGLAEARSIAAQLDQASSPRPNTHDLATQLLERLDATLERVVVTEIRGSTYYALLILERDGQRMEIDSRPSDAIAIALRTKAPIFVREDLFTLTTRETLLDGAAPRVGL